MRYQDGMPRGISREDVRQHNEVLRSLSLGFTGSAIALGILGLVAVLLLTGCAWNEHHARVSPRLDMDKHSATTY